MPSDNYLQLVDRWDESTRALLRRLSEYVATPSSAALEQISEAELADLVGNYINDAENVIEVSRGEMDIATDDVVSALLVSASVMTEALAAAGSDPEEIETLVALGPERVSATWQLDQELAVIDVRGVPTISGAAVPIAKPIARAAERLSNGAGDEVVALFGFGLVQGAQVVLTSGLTEIAGNEGQTAFDALFDSLRGVGNWLKRQATRIVQAAVRWISRNLPRPFAQDAVQLAGQVEQFLATPGTYVGRGLGQLLGSNQAEMRWAQITDTRQARLVVGGLDSRLHNIGHVTSARERISSRWASVVISLLTLAVPQVEIALFVAIAAGVAWVLFQMWSGFRL
jgi:hypothetical protein